MSQQPTPGRIVLYTLSAQDVEQQRRRHDPADVFPAGIHHHPRERTTRMTTPTNPPAGDMTAPSEGRRTRLGEVIYGAMFEVQIDLRYGGAEKAEYIADAVRRALEEAERGEEAITLAEALAQPVERRQVAEGAAS